MAGKSQIPNWRKRGVTYDPETEGDSVRCRLCGRWFRTISWSHLAKEHGTATVDEYKERFSLVYVAAEELRQRLSDIGTRWTPKVVLREIKQRHRLGKSLHHGVVCDEAGGLRLAAASHFGSWGNAVEQAGFDYAAVCREGKVLVWTKERIVKEIRRYRRSRTALNTMAIILHDRNLYSAGRKYFGSWRAAIEAAGMDYDEIKVRRMNYTLEEIKSALQRLHKSGRLLLAMEMKKNPKHKTLYTSCVTHYGNFQKAVEAAGIDYHAFRAAKLGESRRKELLRAIVKHYGSSTRPSVPDRLYVQAVNLYGNWATAVAAAGLDRSVIRPIPRVWTPEKVLAQIHKRRQQDKPLNSSAVLLDHNALYLAACRHWKSWKAAVEAAGYDYESIRLPAARPLAIRQQRE